MLPKAKKERREMSRLSCILPPVLLVGCTSQNSAGGLEGSPSCDVEQGKAAVRKSGASDGRGMDRRPNRQAVG